MTDTVLSGRHFMNGDEACAEGALAAGCRFFAGYPITPSTEVAEHLSRRLPQVGGVFIQMEDELGSMAAILGASAAGMRAMTATSGPGFSLMMENIGLGIMMEIPCVVIDVMRGAPSTGLPTMPGQSDVMQARWGSHGDYESVAYAPWSPQEMFDLTIHCFNVADRYRLPVFLLADEVVGHMVERVVIPTPDQVSLWERKRPSVPPGEPFRPYAVKDDDLVPPMALAGDGYKVHLTGLTHDERGYPEMTAEAHHELVTRLVNKVRVNRSDLLLSEGFDLEGAEILVISYGCTARSARRAVRDARAQGVHAGLLRLVSLWPFAEEAVKQAAAGAKHIIVAEMNLGQMSREVERCLGRPVNGVFHAGGAMIPPDPILQAIMETAK